MVKPESSIIFVNGTSSAGKSTLCRALMEKLELPFWHLSSDHLIDAGMHPKDRFDNCEFNWTEHRPLFFDAFHRSIAAFSISGINLLVEHIVEERAWAQHLAELLADTDIFVVSVTCPLIELRRRERLRSDRTIGEAEYHLKTYNYAPADIEVDSSLPGRQCCDDVLNAWRARTKPSMFSKNWHLV